MKAVNVVKYGVSGFTFDDLRSLCANQDSYERSREIKILVSGYQMAVLNNDTERIAYYQREHRKDYARQWRSWVAQYGIDVAKVIDWLEAYKNGFGSMGYSGKSWSASLLGLVWGDYGRNINEYDNSYVSLIVEMNADFTFKISLQGQEGHGYDIPKTKILSKTASHRSILNQIAFFKRKYSK
jgi:hypothetical protein